MEERINAIEKLLKKLIGKLNFQQKEVITIDEAVELTSLTKSYIYKLSHLGKIPCYSHSDGSKKLYFKKLELLQWMTQSKKFYKDDIDGSLDLLLGGSSSSS